MHSSQSPNDFENGKKDSLQRHAVLEMTEMGHYGTVQILKRRIDKNDEARDIRRGPRFFYAVLFTLESQAIESI